MATSLAALQDALSYISAILTDILLQAMERGPEATEEAAEAPQEEEEEEIEVEGEEPEETQLMQRSKAATTGAEQEDNERGPQRTPSRHQRVMEADPPHRRDRQHQWTSPHPEESSKIPGRQRRC